MKIKDVDFGKVFNSSGARNFDGKGWSHHSYLKNFGLSYNGSTFISKTVTLLPREGNMPISKDFQPLSKFPDCVKVNFINGTVLNAVGLTNPGITQILRSGIWNEQEKPFLISFMAVFPSNKESRLKETLLFRNIIREYLPFKVPVGLQVNFSCPNVGLDPWGLMDEIKASLNILRPLNIPLIAKINATIPVANIIHIQDHMDALSVSNSIPWGKLGDKIDWQKLFDSNISPLAKYGGGGLSGKPLLPIVKDYIKLLRSYNFKKPIIGGGGILSTDDAKSLLDAGADGIELGAVSMLRPWRVQGIINNINKLDPAIK